MRQTFARVDLSRIKKNFLNIKKRVKDVKIMAVVKADAYGHGVKEVVKTLNSLGEKKPDYFGVALAGEAIELRKLKVKQPILVFDPVNNFNVEEYLKFKIIPTVFSKAHIHILNSEYKKRKISGIKIPVHIKIDTGMNRLGIKHNEAFKFIKYLESQKWIAIDGIYTHFATSDEKDKTFANSQLKNFKFLLEKLKSANIKYGIAHAANSGAILDMPESYFDMVRPGISLYGYYPSLETSESIKLFPVMSLHSNVTSVKKYPKQKRLVTGDYLKLKVLLK
jgi:alanine racemase